MEKMINFMTFFFPLNINWCYHIFSMNMLHAQIWSCMFAWGTLFDSSKTIKSKAIYAKFPNPKQEPTINYIK